MNTKHFSITDTQLSTMLVKDTGPETEEHHLVVIECEDDEYQNRVAFALDTDDVRALRDELTFILDKYRPAE